jgi:site-specific DNA recombinase
MRIRSQLDRGIIRSKRYPDAKVEIDEQWVIKDEAKTGRVTRDGYEIIKSGVQSVSFDLLLMDDISRMTRDMGDTIDLYEVLTFKQVEGYSVADQISTLEPHAKDLFVFKGYANEQTSKKISQNTQRGLEMRILEGYSTGQNPYGYHSMPTRMTLIKGIERPSHFEIRITFEEAEVVRRIWTMFADGFGRKAIASVLNREKIPSPRPKHDSSEKGWSETTVGNIIHQDRYIGIRKYRKTKVVKNPMTEKLVQQERAQSE